MKEVCSLPNGKNYSDIAVVVTFILIVLWISVFPYSNSISVIAGGISGLVYIFVRPDWNLIVYIKSIIYGLLFFWTFELILFFRIFSETYYWPKANYQILKTAIPTIIIIPLLFGTLKRLLKKPLN